jgi:hypothetical protein
MTIKVPTRMVHWAIRLAAVAVALGFVWLSQPAVQAQCGQLYCVQGDNGCNADAHYAYETWMGTRDGEPHWGCISNNCNDVHLPCMEGILPPEELEALERAAIVADRTKVESLLEQYSSLTINIERSALQQVDCGGNVVAHIPVPSTLIGDLPAVDQP